MFFLNALRKDYNMALSNNKLISLVLFSLLIAFTTNLVYAEEKGNSLYSVKVYLSKIKRIRNVEVCASNEGDAIIKAGEKFKGAEVEVKEVKDLKISCEKVE